MQKVGASNVLHLCDKNSIHHFVKDVCEILHLTVEKFVVYYAHLEREKLGKIFAWSVLRRHSMIILSNVQLKIPKLRSAIVV